MDLTELQEFLMSLAPVSRMRYQVWDLNGNMLFPPAEQGASGAELSHALRGLAASVVRESRYRHDLFDGLRFMCGYPLSNGSGPFGSLIAYEAEPRSQMTDASDDPLV